jgi:NADH:ubiquinone oxidoreductase subunit 6 (subunit J)
MGGSATCLLVAFVAALLSVVLGRHLTRSLFAAVCAVVAVGAALLSVGAGFAALAATTLLGLALATIQLFGWMLVDADRDPLEPPDAATWIARGLAFGMLAGGFGLLLSALSPSGVIEPVSLDSRGGAAALGALFFGTWRDLAAISGLALGAGLLAALMLLRDDGREH